MLRVFILTSIAFAIAGCSNGADRLEKIKAKGELVVLTRNAATTYYESREGHMGVEYEMAQDFADSLGVKLRFIQETDVSSLFDAVNSSKADFSAAGLTRTDEREKEFLFGPTYQHVTQQLVCRRGGKRPKTPEDLVGIEINVSTDSSYVEQLNKIKKRYPKVKWREVSDTDTETLLEYVWKKKVDCTIADSNIVAINRRYFPELSVRFDLTEPESLAWVLRKNDDGLQSLINDWFEGYKENGKLEEVMHRYYGYIEDFDYVDTRAYQRKIKSHLPKYKKTFKQAAKKNKLNWTLLAAQAYQESHWQANAKSPTGVRGMMMLTRPTAKELGVENRLDATESINGGALYLKRLRKRLPDTINEPDKTWIALAAYNVGMGHIWDARRLAKQLNKNADSWQDLATVLPLLTKKKYYKNLKHGYARGYEPVSYVKNIRDYQNMLEKIMKENSL